MNANIITSRAPSSEHKMQQLNKGTAENCNRLMKPGRNPKGREI